MKKFLVFFVVLFGVACSAMALPQGYANWPYNSQANNVPEDPMFFVGDGFMDIILFFDTGVSVKEPQKYATWAEFLSKYEDQIGSVLVLGSADTKRADGKPKKNIKLSMDRAQWVVDNMLPTNIAKECRFDGVESGKCTVFAMGDANDSAKSDGSRNANANERAARIYVILRQAACQQNDINKAKEMKNVLNSVKDLPKYKDSKPKVEKALEIISQLESLCGSAGKKLDPAQSEKNTSLWRELAAIMLDLAQSIPEVQTVNNSWGITNITVIDADISRYYSKLTQLRDSLKVSAWRDAEGKFNTARLASDSIAGVVLGTVGGIVTSKLVKKNQLKRGFEDLSCNVGGQKVADYGDTFRVGLQ